MDTIRKYSSNVDEVLKLSSAQAAAQGRELQVQEQKRSKGFRKAMAHITRQTNTTVNGLEQGQLEQSTSKLKT